MGNSASNLPAVDLDCPYVTVVVANNTINILNGTENVYDAVRKAVTDVKGIGEEKLKVEMHAAEKFHKVVNFKGLNKEANDQEFACNLLKEMGKIGFRVAFSCVVEVKNPKTCLYFEKDIKSDDEILALSIRQKDAMYVLGGDSQKQIVGDVINDAEIKVQKTKEIGDADWYKFKGYPWSRGNASGRQLILHMLDRLHCLEYKLSTIVAWRDERHSLLFKVPKQKETESKSDKSDHFLVEIMDKDKLRVYSQSEDVQDCIRSLLKKNAIIIQAEKYKNAECFEFKMKGHLWACKDDATAIFARVLIMNMLREFQQQGFNLVAAINMEGSSLEKDEADVFLFNKSKMKIKYKEFCCIALCERDIVRLIGGNEDVHRETTAAINQVVPGGIKQEKVLAVAYPNVQFKLGRPFDSPFGWGLVGKLVASMNSLGWKLIVSVDVTRAYYTTESMKDSKGRRRIDYHRLDADTLYFGKR